MKPPVIIVAAVISPPRNHVHQPDMRWLWRNGAHISCVWMWRRGLAVLGHRVRAGRQAQRHGGAAHLARLLARRHRSMWRCWRRPLEPSAVWGLSDVLTHLPMPLVLLGASKDAVTWGSHVGRRQRERHRHVPREKPRHRRRQCAARAPGVAGGAAGPQRPRSQPPPPHPARPRPWWVFRPCPLPRPLSPP